jgi:hypothetical protein
LIRFIILSSFRSFDRFLCPDLFFHLDRFLLFLEEFDEDELDEDDEGEEGEGDEDEDEVEDVEEDVEEEDVEEEDVDVEDDDDEDDDEEDDDDVESDLPLFLDFSNLFAVAIVTFLFSCLSLPSLDPCLLALSPLDLLK